jgi:hypothetical protein
MHFRRLACFLLGLWLGGAIFRFILTQLEPREAADTIVNWSPSAAAQFRGIPPAQQSALLRYGAAERMRWFAENWDTTQLLFASAFLLYILFATREGKLVVALAGFMLLLSVTQKVFVTPEVIALGRLADFVPSGVVSPERTKLELMKSAYGGLEILKWLAGLFIAGRFVFGRSKRSALGRQEIDMVDKANHRHINR